jgi:hypothetical protein
LLGFLLRPRAGGDEVRAPSRMTRALSLRPLVGGADGSSFFTVLGVDANPDERDAIRYGIHELSWRRNDTSQPYL